MLDANRAVGVSRRATEEGSNLWYLQAEMLTRVAIVPTDLWNLAPSLIAMRKTRDCSSPICGADSDRYVNTS